MVENRLQWSSTVWSYYEVLRGILEYIFLGKLSGMWGSKGSFFIWAEALGIVLTVMYLLKEKIVLVQCCMCKHNGENVDHLLIYCPLDMELWSFVFVVFGVRWVMPRMVYGFASTLGRESTLFWYKIWNACHCVFYRMSGRKRKEKRLKTGSFLWRDSNMHLLVCFLGVTRWS